MDATPSATGRPHAVRRGRTVLLWASAALLTLILSNLVLRVPIGLGDTALQPGPLLAMAGVVLAGVLLWRFPLTTLVLLLLIQQTLVFLTVTPQLTIAQMLPAAVALGRIAGTRSRRVAVPVACFTVLELIVTQLGRPGHDGPTLLDQIQLPAVVLAWLIGDSIRRERAFAVASHARATEQAITAERLRIARELHDMVAHSIGIIAIQAGVGRRVIDTQPAEAREALRAIETTSRETLSGLRRTLVALRQAEPVTGEPVTRDGERAGRAPAPGLADLDRLAVATGDAGIEVEVVRTGERYPLPSDIDLSAYRIVQEALTNVVRHAGTRHCLVTVDQGADELVLEITDDGKAVPGGALGEGFGLTGMRERISLLHGEFSAGPRPGGGFRVRARVPLPERAGRPDRAGERDRAVGPDRAGESDRAGKGEAAR
ncbi:sensor histidine kinase [Streptomyces sp. NPDC058001]|uniref:sensor histidine kinase n=1 Tax=Streptomyces sp. NPDC058001 TaxID=3346300 RepID=UPI0036EF54E9